MEEPAKPVVYKSPTVVSESVPTGRKFWSKSNLPRIIYGAIFLVILVQLIWAGWTILNSRYTASAAPKIQNARLGSVILTPNTPQALVGGVIATQIRISTGGHGTDSTDLIIKFNPAVLEADPSTFFTAGNTYKEYILAQVDNKVGEIRLIGTTPANTEGFVGVGTFGTVNFKAKALGDSPVTVAVNKDSTSESNMVDTLSGNNILEQSFNTNIKIVQNVTPVSTPASFDQTKCSGYTQYCYNMVGQIGSQFCSGGKVANNICSFDPELTTTCTRCNVGL